MSYLTTLKEMRTKRIMKPVTITKTQLEDVIGHLTYMQSAMNAQVLRYVIIDHADEKIFNMTNLPQSHEVALSNQPSAYIVIGTLGDKPDTKVLGMDIGIALEIIKETLFEQKLDCVSINSVDCDQLKSYLNIAAYYPKNIVAIGASDMKVTVEVGSSKTGTDKLADGTHIVYKLAKDTLILKPDIK